jgi:hypothetical protein
MAHVFTAESVAGSLPLDLTGNVPEQDSLIVNVYKPANAANGVMTLLVYDADAPREAELVINGNPRFRLFRSLAVPENDKRLVEISINTPASYWKNGDNKLDFYHVKSGGYAIHGVTVSFDTSGTSDPEPVASFSVKDVEFGEQSLGEASNALSVTLTNSGSAPLNISRISTTSDFIETNNCSDTLPAGGNCIFDIQFVPVTAGDITGRLTVNSDAVNSSEFVRLSGAGISVNDNQTANSQSTTDPSAVDYDSPGIVFYNDLNNEDRHTYTKTDLKTYWGLPYPPSPRGAVDVVRDPDSSGTHNNVLRVFYAADYYGKRGGSGAQ